MYLLHLFISASSFLQERLEHSSLSSSTLSKDSNPCWISSLIKRISSLQKEKKRYFKSISCLIWNLSPRKHKSEVDNRKKHFKGDNSICELEKKTNSINYLPRLRLVQIFAFFREIMISSTCSLCKVKQELISLLVIAVEGNGMNWYCVVHLYLSNDGFGWL